MRVLVQCVWEAPRERRNLESVLPNERIVREGIQTKTHFCSRMLFYSIIAAIKLMR